MKRDDVLYLAREAGRHQWPFDTPFLERFAELVAQHEREACADVAEAAMSDANKYEIADAIRQRGEQ